LAAWVPFCEQHPAECAVDPAEPEIIPLDQTALELIQAVNRYVNHSIIPRRDIEHWGKHDQWDLPSTERPKRRRSTCWLCKLRRGTP
jgi:predicted transglutaminase-like cysteine proteinase